MSSAAPCAVSKRAVSYWEGVTRTTLTTLATGSLSYCVVHVSQQLFRVQYGRKYQFLIPALVAATTAAFATTRKAREYKLL